MPSPSTYLLHTGTDDLERLGLLNTIYNLGSVRLLNTAQMKPGDLVADIGCGHGQITAILSSIVGPKGKVFGLDSAPDQIEVAHITCKDLPNTVFHIANIMDENICDAIKPNSLDAIYCRFVLIHVPDPVLAIKNMLALLKPNGKLILEEPHVLPTRFAPVDESQAPQKTLPSLFSGSDIPVKLYPMLKKLPAEIISYTLHQPVLYTKELKRIPILSLKQRAPMLIEKYGASPEQIESTLKFYEKCINDDNIYLEYYKVHQFIATKQ